MADLPATLRDVAAAARVHPATASRALNPETRMLPTRRSTTIGVLIPDLNNPLFPPMVRGLEDRLTAAGYVALLGNTDSDTSKEQVIFEQMRARHVDGFVLATAHARDPVLAEAAQAGLAVV